MSRLKTAPTRFHRFAAGPALSQRTTRRVELFLDVAGGITGVVGAGLIASNTSASCYGWVFCACSSALLIPLAWRKRIFGVVAMQVIFLVINALGMYRYLLVPS